VPVYRQFQVPRSSTTRTILYCTYSVQYCTVLCVHSSLRTFLNRKLVFGTSLYSTSTCVQPLTLARAAPPRQCVLLFSTRQKLYTSRRCGVRPWVRHARVMWSNAHRPTLLQHARHIHTPRATLHRQRGRNASRQRRPPHSSLLSPPQDLLPHAVTSEILRMRTACLATLHSFHSARPCARWSASRVIGVLDDHDHPLRCLRYT
jgi:hypothetical protein